jgi:hypothetical protein
LDAVDEAAEHPPESLPETTIANQAATELVRRARLTSASIRFIEDAALLHDIGGVGAFLRFRCDAGGDQREELVTDEEPQTGSETPSEDEMRARVIELAFGGRSRAIPGVHRCRGGGRPAGDGGGPARQCHHRRALERRGAFDAEGPGTSDLDLTLVGADLLKLFSVTGFWVPGIHSRPLSDKDPDIAPDLVPLRERLMAMVGRPVNIQATRDFVMYLRGDVLGQPYLTLIGRTESE